MSSASPCEVDELLQQIFALQKAWRRALYQWILEACGGKRYVAKSSIIADMPEGLRMSFGIENLKMRTWLSNLSRVATSSFHRGIVDIPKAPSDAIAAAVDHDTRYQYQFSTAERSAQIRSLGSPTELFWSEQERHSVRRTRKQPRGPTQADLNRNGNTGIGNQKCTKMS